MMIHSAVRPNPPDSGRRVAPARLLVGAVGLVLGMSIAVPSLAAEDLPTAAPESVGMSTERLQRIDEYFQRFIDDGAIAGAVTLVARRGKVVHHSALGWKHREADISMTSDTIFTLMSMTKPIVSAALMMLFEEGRFRLDDPIADWIPEYSDHLVLERDGPRQRRVSEARPVTIRHVLTHTSGLTLNPEGAGLSEDDYRYVTNDGEPFATVAERVARAARIPGAFHPGDHWQYGASTDFVAVLVENISGVSVDVFLRERIFEPLGMTDTFYNVPRDRVDRVAAVYRPTVDGGAELMRAPAFREPRTYFPGVAGLNGTSADYFRFAQMIANGGEFDGVRLLGRMTVDLMISNHTAHQDIYVRGPGYGFGLGFGVLVDPTQSFDTLSPGSYGWGGAYGTLYWADPAEDLIGLMFIQLPGHGPLNIRQRFTNVVTQAVVDSLADQRPTVLGYAIER
ncbi:MAG: serine hydrolase domain-containing protein [Acidobacteriota bacterium]|nr:serine hydrolase domain-containing protein [Acidobacteriota bacterium]